MRKYTLRTFPPTFPAHLVALCTKLGNLTTGVCGIIVGMWLSAAQTKLPHRWRHYYILGLITVRLTVLWITDFTRNEVFGFAVYLVRSFACDCGCVLISLDCGNRLKSITLLRTSALPHLQTVLRIRVCVSKHIWLAFR